MNEYSPKRGICWDMVVSAACWNRHYDFLECLSDKSSKFNSFAFTLSAVLYSRIIDGTNFSLIDDMKGMLFMRVIYFVAFKSLHSRRFAENKNLSLRWLISTGGTVCGMLQVESKLCSNFGGTPLHGSFPFWVLNHPRQVITVLLYVLVFLHQAIQQWRSQLRNKQDEKIF